MSAATPAVARPVAPAAPHAASPAPNGPVAVSPGQPVTTAPPVAQTGASGNGEATADAPKKRGRKKLAEDSRKPHPSLNANAEGQTTTPIDTVPADYNEDIHLPLRRKDFKSEVTFLEWKAGKLEDQAKEYRKQADQLKALGSVENQEDARKAIRLQSQLEQLTKNLKAKNIDVAALLGLNK